MRVSEKGVRMAFCRIKRHQGAALDLPGSTAAVEIEELKNFICSIQC
jgi:hypothetical protein